MALDLVTFSKKGSTLTKGEVDGNWDDIEEAVNDLPAEDGDNSWTGQQSFVETKDAVFEISGATPVIDPANGNLQYWVLSANSAPTEALEDGQLIAVMIDDGAEHTITWPAMTWQTLSGTAPQLKSTGYTVVILWKLDGDLYGAAVGV